MARLETIPQYLLEQVRRQPAHKIAMRQKEFGIWQESTWPESIENISSFAMGLIALGFNRGDHVATVGDNDRQYVWGYLAVLAAGGTQIGLFTDAPANEIAYIVDHSNARFVLARDQEQCDKLLSVRAEIPGVDRVIYWDERGLWDYDDPWLLSFHAVQALGRERAASEPERFAAAVAEGRSDDLAVLCYTSGTTGLPKGAMLSHANLLAVAEAYNAVDERLDTDNHVSLLPLGWIAEHTLGVVPHVMQGVIMNFPEEPETTRENVREIAPDNILYNSRLWDMLVGTVQVRMNDANWLYRKLYEWFLPLGYQVADRKLANRALGFGLASRYKVADWLLFSPLRDQLGLSQIRAAYTAGSSLSPDAMRFFHGLGINLKQIYGVTEVTGGATLHRDGDIKFASVGMPVPGVKIRISAAGEILIGGPTVFQGYYRDPEATAAALYVDDDGERWFCSGDAGHLDEDGHLIYLERVKDMITLADGERYSPQFLEGRLKFNPYVQDVMVVGGETRHFVAALVIIDFDNVARWAEKRGIGYTTFVDLSQRDEVYLLIGRAIVDVNRSLPSSGQVRRFVLMHKAFDADEAEMTRTRKLRRGFLADRYGDIIEAIYSDANRIHVEAPVRYRDGREGVIETELQIMTLEEQPA